MNRKNKVPISEEDSKIDFNISFTGLLKLHDNIKMDDIPMVKLIIRLSNIDVKEDNERKDDNVKEHCNVNDKVKDRRYKVVLLNDRIFLVFFNIPFNIIIVGNPLHVVFSVKHMFSIAFNLQDNLYNNLLPEDKLEGIKDFNIAIPILSYTVNDLQMKSSEQLQFIFLCVLLY